VNKVLDWELLERHFYVTAAHRTDTLYSINAKELLRKEEADKFVALYGERIKAKVPEAACTYFSGFLAGLCSAVQFLLSHHDVALDYGLHNLTIQLYLNDQQKPSFSFVLHDCTCETASAEGDRTIWREAVLSKLYAETVRPIIEALAEAAHSDASTLWRVLPTGVYYRYEEILLQAAHHPALSEQIKDDFAFLVHGIQGDVFGRKRNPFDIKLKTIPSWKNPDEQLRQKTGCCLYYQTEGGTYCYTCPRIDDKMREQRKQELLAQYGLLKAT
jgi:ferric iron reductase protein FhuF